MFILFAVQAVALNSRLEAQYGLLGHGGHLYPPRRVIFHNMVLEHLAAATMKGLSAALGDYSASLDGDLDPRDLVQSRRLAHSLQAVLKDVQQMKSSFEHERSRSQDASRFGFHLAVEDFEQPSPTASADTVRMDYVLWQAKRDSGGAASAPSASDADPTPRGRWGYWLLAETEAAEEGGKGQRRIRQSALHWVFGSKECHEKVLILFFSLRCWSFSFVMF